MKNNPIIRRITESAGLYAEAIPGSALVELCGDDRVLIENHKSVLAYCDNSIDVRMPYGIVTISGSKLSFACVQQDRLVIRGRIEGVTIVRGDKR